MPSMLCVSCESVNPSVVKPENINENASEKVGGSCNKLIGGIQVVICNGNEIRRIT